VRGKGPPAVQYEAQIFYPGPNWDGHTRDLNRIVRGRPSATKINGLRFLGRHVQPEVADVALTRASFALHLASPQSPAASMTVSSA